jgi:hypothetical protein
MSIQRDPVSGMHTLGGESQRVQQAKESNKVSHRPASIDWVAEANSQCKGGLVVALASKNAKPFLQVYRIS